jgi:hypothetical protein
MQSTIQNTQLSRRVGAIVQNIPIDQLAENLPNSNIWRTKDIDAFVKKSVRTSVLCCQTTAATNIYIANPDDSDVQYLGEKVLHQYIYADEYLEKLQASISTAIAMHRAVIRSRRIKLETLIDRRSDTGRMSRLEDREKTREMEVLKRIVRLPEVLVELIKEYIPTTIMVAVFRSARHNARSSCASQIEKLERYLWLYEKITGIGIAIAVMGIGAS